MAEKSNIDGVTITSRGLRLITKLVAAKSQMEFTNVKVGTGILAEGDNPYELTHLVQYKMDGMIAGYGFDEAAMDAYVVMQLSNNQVETGFVMTEVGLYAMDPDIGEILYGYLDLSKDPNYIMPAENGRAKTVQIKLHVIVGEVKEIKASVSPLSQVTREELEKELEKLYRSKNIALLSADWGEEAPYVQTVGLKGVSPDTVLDGGLYIPAGTTPAQEKALIKAASCVSYFDTGDGTVTVTCIGKKPAVDFQIQLKGV